MKKKAVHFLASLFVMATLLFAPSSGEAAFVRQYPEFGPNQMGQVLDDFMLKSNFDLGRYYTADFKGSDGSIVSKSYHNQGSDLTVSVNKANVITKIRYMFHVGYSLSDAQMESMYRAWSNAVKQRYGNPTEEYSTSSKFTESGKYKYNMSVYNERPYNAPFSEKKSLAVFCVEIEAL